MAPLLILIVGFIILAAINYLLLGKKCSWSFTGRLAMSIMLLFTGMAHFTNTNLMVDMMPDALAWKEPLVYLTGLLEWVLGLALLTTRWSVYASIVLLLFFIAVLPANIVGSLKAVPLGGMENGPDYLYFRIPLQLFFILWVYFFGIRINKITTHGT